MVSFTGTPGLELESLRYACCFASASGVHRSPHRRALKEPRWPTFYSL